MSQERDFSFTYDQSLTDLWIGGTHLRIPHAYIWPWMSTKKTDDGRIEATAIPIAALLPDFAMISPENAACFKDTKTCDANVFVMISEGNWMPAEERSLGLYKQPRDALRQGPAGLLIYDRNEIGAIEHFGQEIEGQLLPIWCDRESRPQVANCHIYGQLTMGVKFDAEFRRSRLAEWSEIYRRVNAALAGFVTHS